MENVDLTDVMFRGLLNGEGIWMVLLAMSFESRKSKAGFIIGGTVLILCATSLLRFHDAALQATYYQCILMILSVFIFGVIYNYFHIMEKGKPAVSEYEMDRIRHEITQRIQQEYIKEMGWNRT